MANESLGANFSIDISNLRAGLKEANQRIRETQSEFKAAAAGMDDWSHSEEGLTAKIKSLSETTDLQQKKVDALKQEYERLISEGLDPASNEASKLRTQINNEEAALEKTKKELDDNTEALKNLGKESVDSGGKMEKFGDIMKGVGKVAAAGFGAAAAGLAALTKQAVEGYSDYEQLVGGVETLFGAGGQSLEEYAKSVGKSVSEVKGEYSKLINAQDTLIKNANNAYKTAGMSANDYMENVTSFSAALIGSLGGDTEEAAKVADRAMIDMADNANKMGTDMQSIVQTYQALAKGNFQMLDNLKLGYGGTKSEMERLIEDAAKMTDVQKELGVTVKEGDLSFANMANAISIVQKNMGIAGATANEASTTIQGSAAAMKSAWDNLVNGLADQNADFDQLVYNFIDSAETMLENLIPTIISATEGIFFAIEKLIPLVPPLIEKFLPSVIGGIMSLLDGVVMVFPTIVDTVLQIIPDLISNLIEFVPSLVQLAIDIVIQIIHALSETLPAIVDAVIKVVPLIISSLVAAIPELLKASIEFLMAILDALPVILTELVKALPEIISTITNFLIANIPAIVLGAVKLLLGIVEAIPQMLPALIMALPDIIIGIVDGLIDGIPEMIKVGKDMLSGLFEGLLDPRQIWESVKKLFNDIVGGLKKLFGIQSPSKVMENVIGKNLALGIGEGFDDNIGKVNSKIAAAMQIGNPYVSVSRTFSGTGGGQTVVINQNNHYSQAHSRYEIYKSKQQTAAAVRLALAGA